MSSKIIRTSKDEANKLAGKTIDILVGDYREAFSVLEGLIRVSSTFFEKAMAGQWQESSKRTIELTEDEPIKYSQCLSGNIEYIDLVKAYVLGDKILDPGFQDATIDAIIEKSVSKAQDGSKWFPVGEAIVYANSNTCESALIRKLLVDMYARHGCSRWLHDWGETTLIPQPFLLDLASKLLSRRERYMGSFDPSAYHIHVSVDEKIRA